MDEYLDHLLSSSSWVDGDAKESGVCGELNQSNVLLPGSFELYQDNKRNSPLSMVSSNQSAESLATQDTSSVAVGGESDYAVDNALISEEARLQNDGQNCNGNPSNGVVTGNMKQGNMVLQCEATLPALSSMNYPSMNYPKKHLVVDDFTSRLSFTETCNAGGNVREQSEHLRSLKNLQNVSSFPPLWPLQSFGSVSTLPHLMGQDRIELFSLQGANMDDNTGIIGKRYESMDKSLQLDKLSAPTTTEGKEDLQNRTFSSVMADPNTAVAVKELSSLPQTTSAAPAGGCNGTGKPRVRARRGHATDPHSIAERLRREKIAERMKNLQELVPNSNKKSLPSLATKLQMNPDASISTVLVDCFLKTSELKKEMKVDKASMLDEIIEYVKFLQLQVKVLSMSRLGAAGAVIPLLTDGQHEGHNSLSLSPSPGKGTGIDISPSPDQIVFEQEVLKLMESNVTTAMQHLQSKGLCLMPVALASAISGGKASLSEERKKFGYTSGLGHSGSCSLPGIEALPPSYDGDVAAGKLGSY